jgi:hypothetical protein
MTGPVPTNSAPAPRWTKVGEGCLDVADAAGIENDELLADSKRSGLHVSPFRLGTRMVRFHQHGNCCRLGHELAQQLQSLRPHLAGEKVHARDVGTRPVQAGDEAVPDRVAPSREDDWNRCGCGLGCEDRDEISGDHSHWPVDQFGHQCRQPINLIVCIAIFDGDVLALDEARFLQALAERAHVACRVGERRAAQEPDHGHRWLLRAGRDWPRDRHTAQQLDELAPSHVGPAQE